MSNLGRSARMTERRGYFISQFLWRTEVLVILPFSNNTLGDYPDTFAN